LIEKNGEKTELDVPAQLVSERTMVPIRAVSEAFSCTVDWDDAASTVVITAKSEEKENVETQVETEEIKEEVKETEEKSVLSEFDIQEKNGMYKLLKKDGTVVAVGEFKEISEINGLIVTTSNSDYKTVYNKDGKNVASGDKITDCGRGIICVEAERVANGMLRVKYVNSSGEVFSTIYKNENSTLARLAYDQEYIYNDKKYTTPKVVSSYKSNDNDYVLLDINGNMISEPVFQRVFYYNGLYTVTENINIRSTGVIDESGNVILPRIYSGVTVCDNIILAKDNNSKIFMFDYNGKQISDEWFSDVGNFHDGFAFVKRNVDDKTKKGGFINEKGEIVIPLIYEDVESFINGKARVKLDGKYIHIDTAGNIAE